MEERRFVVKRSEGQWLVYDTRDKHFWRTRSLMKKEAVQELAGYLNMVHKEEP